MREAINKGKFVQDTHYVVGFQSTARFIVSIPPSFLFLSFLSWHLSPLSRGNKFSFSVAPQDVAAIAQCPLCAVEFAFNRTSSDQSFQLLILSFDFQKDLSERVRV